MISAGDPGQEALSVGKITKSRMGSHSLPCEAIYSSVDFFWNVCSGGGGGVFLSVGCESIDYGIFVFRRANLASRVLCVRDCSRNR